MDELGKTARALQAAVDRIPLPALVLSPDGGLLALNRAADTLFSGTGVPGLLLHEARSLARGLTNNEIAERQGVSFETVRTQISRSLSKMNVKNRATLASVAVAAAFGIGPEEE